MKQHNKRQISLCLTCVANMASAFFTKDEIDKFTLPNASDYHDIDRLEATIVPEFSKQATENDSRKSCLQRTAYALFFHEQNMLIRAQNRNVSFGEISKFISNLWQNSSDQLKRDYKRRVQLERKKELIKQAYLKANSVSSSSESSDTQFNSNQ